MFFDKTESLATWDDIGPIAVRGPIGGHVAARQKPTPNVGYRLPASQSSFPFWGTFPASSQNADPQVSGGGAFTTRSGEKIVRVPYPRNWQDLRTRVRRRGALRFEMCTKKAPNTNCGSCLWTPKRKRTSALSRERVGSGKRPCLCRERESAAGAAVMHQPRRASKAPPAAACRLESKRLATWGICGWA